MRRSWSNIPAHRLAFMGVFLVPLVAAVGLAWACVPTARTGLSPVSGPAGIQATMSGSGFPGTAETVDIYLDTRGASDTPIKTATMGGSGDDKTFSTQVTMPTALGAHLLIPVPRNSSGGDVGSVPGSGGAGPPAAVFQVTDPSLSTAPGFGRAGSSVKVSGANFKSGTVNLHWDSAGGPKLGSAQATGNGFTFAKQVTVPAGATGSHKIVGVPFGDPADTASANFTILPTPPPPAAARDSVGPSIVAAALTSGNGTKTVSNSGSVTIFCGRFDEPGVSGECGAKSAKKLKVASASRSAVLKLSAKPFSAEPGKPVKVKFRLKRASMKMLKRARKVRMRGTVSARDAKGNASTPVAFSFTLKAPKTRKP